MVVSVIRLLDPWKPTPGRLRETLQTHPRHPFSCGSGLLLEPVSELMV